MMDFAVYVPKYSVVISALLEKGTILQEWDKFIEETANHVLSIGKLDSMDVYNNLGRLIYQRFPCIRFSIGVNPWVNMLFQHEEE